MSPLYDIKRSDGTVDTTVVLPCVTSVSGVNPADSGFSFRVFMHGTVSIFSYGGKDVAENQRKALLIRIDQWWADHGVQAQ